MDTETDERAAQSGNKTMDSMIPLLQTGRRLRSSSLSTATRLLAYNPAGGMWQATGTAIAHAPNIMDLKSSDEVGFDIHGRSVRRVKTQDMVVGQMVRRATAPAIDLQSSEAGRLMDESSEMPHVPQLEHIETHRNEHMPKLSWRSLCKKISTAVWRFICTPTGLFITIYGLNVVAWGAMLFFLLLNVGSLSKERKELWIEIDSQILNGLFCLTSWGLAPWRIRDTYWLLMWHFGSKEKSKRSVSQLAKRNASWFRIWDTGSVEEASDNRDFIKTATGNIAPATSSWKMDFVVINMLLNSLFQIGMATFMWYYDRHNRPSFGVGLFIGLGCFSSLLAGIMSWWEGRKVKLIEGPMLESKTESMRHCHVQKV
ncbi:hypothetical protein N7532_005381 [Penicillium argentinense]|uniref:Uncharacterized protein n=1 Tax=Penicillium argentinense TaxID=1131581 RepID=A0A9W9FE28_9EURO|nr:uncharacterized protein N7532_005381 [Penicillium argentinense]KAJ5098380.1 hypothetical protein N7532_005381 [Penicillium argentinense]